MAHKAPVMDAASVRHAYRRWAPVYDFTFGLIAEAGRKNAVQIINRRKGRVLEVGVGTGLSLPCYGSHLTITGIDLSPEMLAKAQDKVERKSLGNVVALHEMDAGALAFPDESFDTVVAMYVMTVVPEPDRVMRELERVCAAGGEVILVNHFSQDEGVRGLHRAEARAVCRVHRLAPGVRARSGAGLRRSQARRAPFAAGRSACSPCCASSRSLALGLPRNSPRAASKRALRRACRCAPGCRSRSGSGSNGRSPARWCIAGVCLTPIIGDPYIGDCKANWRSNIRRSSNWRSSSAG